MQIQHFIAKSWLLAFLALCPVFTPVGRADEAFTQPVPPGGTALLPADGVGAFAALSNENVSAQTIAVTGQPFAKALQLTTLKQTVHAYDVQATATTIAPIRKGDVCLAVFAMRVTQSGGGYGRANFVLEDGTSFSKSVNFEAEASGAWKTFYAPFTAVEDEPTGQAHINLQIGFLPQTIEVADVHVTDYGSSIKISDLPATQFTYEGREADAPWRKAAAARIDKYRKGNIVVKVVNASGKPVPGARVHIQQTRHAFGFGTAVDNIFMQDTPQSAQYRALTYSLYNEAVIGNALKAGQWINASTHTKVLKFVHDLHEHDMEVRGHNLVWPSWSHSSFLEPLKNDPPALAARILSHITDEVGTLKGQCFEWDVVNEAYNNHDVQDILGPHCLVDWYNAAHAADPAARLFINDYSITEGNGGDVKHIDAYDAQIKYLLDNKAPLGGIGLQSHFGRILTPPTKVYDIMNRFARFGLPLEVTEFDVNVPSEQLQADYLRDYMTIAFSHPAIRGFVMWGFWQGDHWIPDAALFRTDFSIKPNGQMYKDLVFHQWWTDTKGASNGSGKFTARAFLGNYQITASRNGRAKTVPVSITKSGSQTTVVTITL